MNPKNMTMVVSRYNENLDWLKDLPWNYVIYNKGEDNLPEWIKNIIKLPNIGREAHTYLTYIIDNYENLPDYSLFVQGNPFDHATEIMKKINDFVGGDDFYTLTDRIPTCHTSVENVDQNRYSLSHFVAIVAESAKKIFLKDMHSFEYAAGAEFILSKKAIHFHTKNTYQKIMDLVIEGTKTVSERCLRRRHLKNCKCMNLFSPWVMERLWKTLFENKTIYD